MQLFHAKTITPIHLKEGDFQKTIPVGTPVVVYSLQSGELCANDGQNNFIIDLLEFTKETVH